ncbi:MAG: hypothetical protein A3I44_03635 [Candidatus Sungbacteria bacterium RIFCSPLOWO2_02_FULL_51_17]|uniref:Uncharacterized protein n=1 Tax=Candidatus Sungbacteria bacterium RIFCSPHIGHO2_02_FULL_51_29 TaxID=1802273 RepID=A0A1G2KS01_9BACT|nr:MAG: hypothetical protein A2676_03415 [Candidatus Sungbacteria bacterium RIFCSPHIGHO2_01_FULL_51_22]OHA02123.1 MAG: hypothetical protein A3C16_04915 [Candidatus Sungbacteria bacterium RIFCSPHIGHO2_02_FULL_51_29]OHA07131.1 MAG: hypothetical protein A3B29_02690 [Candidatus Sungbacteria bacterium RIFCSPLOWO2_01_FULL_51_34]OHA10479.1 MAG: hypothetical protein A3I44_03635 [Candidatus Sungbacteria bacterium RIFCSPLOWO2_02_FULL_51_17]
MFFVETEKVDLDRALNVFWIYIGLIAAGVVVSLLQLEYSIFIPFEIVTTLLGFGFGYVVTMGFRQLAKAHNAIGLYRFMLVAFIVSVVVDIVDTGYGILFYAPGEVSLGLVVVTELVIAGIFPIAYGYCIGTLPMVFGKLPFYARIMNMGIALFPFSMLLGMWLQGVNNGMDILFGLGILAGVVFWVISWVIDYRILKRAVEVRDSPGAALANGSTLEEKKLHGLRGWLILVALGLLVALWRMATTLYADINVLGSENYQALFDPASPVYVENLGLHLKLEFVFVLVLFIGAACSAVLFFMKKKIFPVLYMCWLLLGLLFAAFEVVMPSFLVFASPDTEKAMMDVFSSNTPMLAGAIVGALIWIPYMLRSKRVTATFIQ